jgi:3-oxoacyl-[acyl-carrier protein] reductase
MPITIDLSNKTALVTGASQGLGEAIARRLHEAGCRVLLNHPGLENTSTNALRIAAELNTLCPNSALELSADVGDAEAVQAMMQRAQSEYGGIDFLINNAAILRDRSVSKMSLDEWHDAIQVNLNGVFYCCKYGLEIMRDGGAITNLSSISAILGFYGQANYAAAKAGVASLAKVLARECGKRNIRANAIAPGIIETAMTQTIPENVRDEMLKNIPLNRLGKPNEVADLVLFLCSPLASYINGQVIEINGGWRG